MLGKLSAQEIEEVLASEIVGRIGCHADDTTYIVPVSYAYDGDYIYGLTDEGMKVTMMRKNPDVCFQADHMDNMANWKSVIAWGEFEELVDPEERKRAIQKLINRDLPMISSETVHITPQWPFKTENTEEIKGIVYRLKLKEKTGRFEKSNGTSYFAS